MRLPGFQTLSATIGYEGNEELRVAYLDNQADSDAPCLLLLHGLFDNKATWSRLCDRLKNHCRIIAPDLIGCGHSSKPLLADRPESYRYSAAMHVDILERFIEHLGLDALILVGNSLGGGIALQLYLTCGRLAERTRGLILIDAAGYPQELPGHVRELAGWPGRLLDSRLFRFLLFHAGLMEYIVERTFRRAFHDPGRIPADLVEEAVTVLRIPHTFRAYRLAARNIVPPDHRRFIARYPEVTCPTLVLWGEKDRIVPSLFALRFKEDIPHATLHLFPDCGHAPQLEHPQETAVLIRDWLQERFQAVE